MAGFPLRRHRQLAQRLTREGKVAKRKSAAVDLLQNWNTLNGALLDLREEDVEALLKRERAGKNRLSYTLRLHSRLSRMRRERERREIASG